MSCRRGQKVDEWLYKLYETDGNEKINIHVNDEYAF